MKTQEEYALEIDEIVRRDVESRQSDWFKIDKEIFMQPENKNKAFQCRFVVSSDQLFFVDDEYAGTVKLTNLDNGESNISFPSCDDGLIINPADKHIK